MKDLVRFLTYAACTAAVVAVLSIVSQFESLRGDFLVILAVITVIVGPVLIGVWMGKRERSKSETGPQ
ncbi:MAG TPA: hypothetical protein ENJ19_01070 [Gammaproteobacteria bacterium]|nr:hypothetical protein [Gammaproteobacteria bacterium]